jgi:VanZ family protein
VDQMRSITRPRLRGRVRIMPIIGSSQSRIKQSALRGSLSILAISLLLAICAASLVPGEFRPHTNFLPSAFEHVAAYGLAAFCLGLAYYRRLSPIWLVLLLTAYGALLELGQLWAPGRHSQLLDVIADFAGALIGVLVALALMQLSRMVGARRGGT